MTVPSLPPRAPSPAPPPLPAGEAPSRPESIAILIQLSVVALVFQLIAMPGSYAATKDRAVALVNENYSDEVNDPESFAQLMAISGIVVSSLLLVALVVSLILFVLRGKGWARFLLGWIMAILALMMIVEVFGVVFGETPEYTLPVWAMIARIIGGVAALGALFAAMHPDTRKYVEQVAAFRRGPQQGTKL